MGWKSLIYGFGDLKISITAERRDTRHPEYSKDSSLNSLKRQQRQQLCKTFK
jgi:hypothetical protein